MNIIKNVLLENHRSIIESLQYGENFVTYENEEAHKLTLNKIKVLNAYFDFDAIEERKASYIELPDGSFSYETDGIFVLIYRKMNYPVPVLHIDNYLGEHILNETIKYENISRHLSIDARLRKYYRNLGLIMNVKFKENRFDATNRKGGQPKKIGGGVANQIREAYLNGEKSICFSSYRCGLQSIRNAASNFGKMVNKKFSVEIHGYEIFVIFKEFTENERNEILFKNLILSMKSTDTKERITALFHEFLDFEVPEKEFHDDEDFVNYDERENPNIIEPEITKYEDPDDDF